MFIHFGYFESSSIIYDGTLSEDKSEYLCLKNMSISTKRSFCHAKALSLFTSKYVSPSLFILLYFILFHSIPVEIGGIRWIDSNCCYYALRSESQPLFCTHHNVFILGSTHISFLYSASCVQSRVKRTHFHWQKRKKKTKINMWNKNKKKKYSQNIPTFICMRCKVWPPLSKWFGGLAYSILHKMNAPQWFRLNFW